MNTPHSPEIPSPSLSESDIVAFFEHLFLAPLPKDFMQWQLEAPRLMLGPTINLGPLSFTLRAEAGTPLAHLAAQLGHLPAEFDAWDFLDMKGQTVAYVAAVYGALPATFKHLSIANRSGWTVAHEMASRGRLPAAFDGWHWKDEAGQRVIDVARAQRQDGLVRQYEAWRRAQLVDRGMARPRSRRAA